MTLVLTVPVREGGARLLQQTIEYHLDQGVDCAVVSGSLTQEELAPLHHAGAQGQVRLLPGEPGLSPWRHAERLARFAARECGATWVLQAVPGEFWVPVEGTLSSTFASVPPQYGIAECEVFDMLPPAVDQDWWKYAGVRRRSVRVSHSSVLTARYAHRAHEQITIDTHGRVGVVDPAATGFAPLPAIERLADVFRFSTREPADDHVLLQQDIAVGLDVGALVTDTRFANWCHARFGPRPRTMMPRP